ncbi:MAG: LON peptidase substrate-binding domain-containing protein, partial [Bacteroidota bacterium]|nr:LON peptidase substrate-binding domain-containing protein [Bacteroidota bacterium]
MRLSDIQDQDFIPILTEEDEHAMQEKEVPEVLPLLSLRNTVLFPGVVIPISVGRDRSVRLIREANKSESLIGVVSQKEDDTEVPGPDDLNKVGTVARILKMLKMPDGTNTVILQGQQRFRWTKVIQEEPYHKAKVEAYGGVDEPLP